MAASSQWRRLGVLGLAAFALVTCLVGLHDSPRLGDHECINALAARQTLETGCWLIPHIGELPLIRKPPLGTWLIAASSYLVDGPMVSPPVSDYAARLPSALAAWGTVLLVYWLGRQMYGHRAGLTAGFISAGSMGVVFFAHNAQVDMVLTFFTTLSFACFWRGALHDKPSRWAMAAFYLAFALAMMAKAPLPLVTVGLALVAYWFVTAPLLTATDGTPPGTCPPHRARYGALRAQFHRLSDLWGVPGLLLFLLAAGAWPVYVLTHVDGASALWRAEYLDRFSGDMTDGSQPVWYYVPILLGLTAPYLLSLSEAVAAPFVPRYTPHRKGLAFAFTWAIVGTLFLSTSAFKRPHYVLSLVPAYCLLLGPVIDRLFFGEVAVAGRAVQSVCRLLPVLIAAAAVAGGVLLDRVYPDLLRNYVLAVILAVLLWKASCRAFARDRRMVSFAELNMGVLLLLLAIWPCLRGGLHMNAEGDALASALRANHVQPDDLVFWLHGRPDASVEFYSGFRIRRLINEIEMTSYRSHRKALPAGLYREYAERIGRALDASGRTYLIMRGEHLAMLEKETSTGHRVLFRLEGFHESAEDELVVVTQNDGAPSSDARHAAELRTARRS